MHTYRNPWHDGTTNNYGAAMYQTDAKPHEYRGFQIFNRIAWDVVKDGVCLTQRYGFSGAKAYVDAMLDHPATCDCSICMIHAVHNAAGYQKQAA